MKTRWAAAAPVAGVLLLLCQQAYAHALFPGFYPLGPYPAALLGESPVFVFAIAAPVFAVAGLLRWWIPKVSFWASLWRSAILCLLARAVEFPLIAVIPGAGWTGEEVELAGQVVGLLLVSTAAQALGVRLLYGPAGWPRILGVAIGIGLVGYLIALVSCRFIMSILLWH